MNKILIVDDHEQKLYLLKSVLGGNGYQVVEAANGAQALALAGEPDGQGATHPETDDAMDVALDVLKSIEIFTARVNVLQ